MEQEIIIQVDTWNKFMYQELRGRGEELEIATGEAEDI